MKSFVNARFIISGTWDMILGKIEAVTGRSKSKDKQNRVSIDFPLLNVVT